MGNPEKLKLMWLLLSSGTSIPGGDTMRARAFSFLGRELLLPSSQA